MIELVEGDKTITIPEEMTIGMYQAFIKDTQKYTDEPIELIALFTNLSKDKLKNLSTKTIKLINYYVQSKVKIPKLDEMVLTFNHNGVEYGLETDFGKMAWGAWVDLEVYSSDNISDNIHKLMSVLYRPVISKSKDGKKYVIEPYDSATIDERAELFLTLPISYWFTASDFFLSVVSLSITNIKASLEQKNRMKKLMERGMKMLPQWVRRKLPQDFTLS